MVGRGLTRIHRKSTNYFFDDARTGSPWQAGSAGMLNFLTKGRLSLINTRSAQAGPSDVILALWMRCPDNPERGTCRAGTVCSEKVSRQSFQRSPARKRRSGKALRNLGSCFCRNDEEGLLYSFTHSNGWLVCRLPT